MHSLIIFASGRGSNAAAIIDYFRGSNVAKVDLIVCNKANAGVLDIARNEHIPFLIVDKESFNETLFIDQLQSYHPSLIILAGFFWKVPDGVIQAFRGHIINIHPALLPSYGGRGMYGHHVHNAVLAERRTESGITIHYVDEIYDNGDIILQARCPVFESDTADELALRIHRLEHFYYPRAINFLLNV
jgi:phosphoribosylglycinamide formyltransferase 1